jgi:S1-C subfamily serine protease
VAWTRGSSDLKINAEGMEQVARLLFRLVVDLGNRDQLSGFRSAARNETPSGRSAMDRGLPPVTARFGVRWDTAEDEQASDGLKLVHVAFGSAASAAGLQVGDRLLEFSGEPITSGDQLRRLVLAARNPVAAKIARAGKEEPQDVEINLTGQPLRIGISWREDPAEPGSVHLVRVVPSSPAAIAGLRVRDRIYQIGGEDFADGNAFLERLNTLPNPIDLLVERRGQLQTLQMTLPPKQAPLEENPAE